MNNQKRRNLIKGATAAAITLLPSMVRTPLTPAMQLMQQSLAADIPRPDHIIRMHANENPYGPSRVALKAIADNINLCNRYSGPPTQLIEMVAKSNGVSIDNVAVGTGSDEILKVAGIIAASEGGSVVCPDPTFQALPRYASQFGAEIIRVPVDENLNTDLNAMRSAVRADTKLIYLVNPNNPIPSIIEKNRLRDFVLEMSKQRIVFIDEAYHEFVENADYQSMIDLVANGHENIIISRTASKIHGLAGVRIGFGFAAPGMVNKMNLMKTGDTLALSEAAALASYRDTEFPALTLRKNRESQAILTKMCDELKLDYIKSNTNFAFIKTNHQNSLVQNKMKEFGILTGRDFKPFHDSWSRISMSTPQNMVYFTQVYKQLFS